MKRRILILTGLLLVGLLTTAAFAYGGSRGHGGWFSQGRGFTACLDNLNLTAEQTAQMNTLRDNHRKEVQPLRDKMLVKRHELRNLWLEANPDPAKINAAQKEMQVLRNQMQDKMTAFRLSALNLLTPEQKAEAQRNYRERSFKHGRGPAGCPGGPGLDGQGSGK